MNLKDNKAFSPAYLALAAAILFGASTPASKVLIGEIHPQLLAGLLYLGSGLGLSIYSTVTRQIFGVRQETALNLAALPGLAGAVIFGGVAAPLLLMFGLATTQATQASLLLNFEAVFTALLAWLAFKENFDRRVMLGMLAIVAGGILLSWSPGARFAISFGSLFIIGACFCWGLDNNVTRSISASDPIQIAAVKGLAAGTVNCTIAFILGNKLPPAPLLLVAALTGFLGYGASLSLYIRALRHLGTARSGAYFSTAPFAGAFISLFILHESLTANFAIAAVFMGLGVWLHLTETHEHEHTHPEEEHEHLHVHDQHHQHEHEPHDSAIEPHNHPHHHNEITHSHSHFPDIDHRHEHQ